MSDDTNTPNGGDDIGSFYVGRTRVAPEPQRMMPRGLLTVISVIGFIGLIWYAYPDSSDPEAGADLPVVAADTSPYKSAPADAGGMDVPHRDSTVFDAVSGGAQGTETIVETGEQPMDKSRLGLDPVAPALNLEPQGTAAVEAPLPAATEAKPEPAPKTEDKPAPAAEAGAWVQLGAFGGEKEAEKAWLSFQKKYSVLKGLDMRTQKVTPAGKAPLYRLQAGLPDSAAAKKACDALKKAKAACMVVK